MKKFENLKKRKGKPLSFGSKVKIRTKSRVTTADANGFTKIEIEKKRSQVKLEDIVS